MPFTPFHFGPGAAIHAAAPRHISFLAFCGANVLTDIEPLYYMLTRQYPLHRFFHTYVGASGTLLATALLFLGAQRVARRFRLRDYFGIQRLAPRAIWLGAAVGAYSHIALDSVMHADMVPLAPFSQANALYGLVPVEMLHLLCIIAAIAGLALLEWRANRASSQVRD